MTQTQHSPVNANSAVLMVRARPYMLCVGLPVLVEVGRRDVTGKGEALGGSLYSLCLCSPAPSP